MAMSNPPFMGFTLPACAAALTLAISGCGGGGSSGQGNNLQGTAAVGAAIVEGTVTAKCADGSGFTQPVTTDSNGHWSGMVNAASFPCALQITGGTPAVTLHSYARATGTANITPLTDMLIAVASAQMPATWFDGSGWQLDPAALDNALDDLLDGLEDAGYDLPEGDPLATEFVVGDAWDRVLDALGAAVDGDGAITDHEALLALLKDGNLGNIPEPPDDDDIEAPSGFEVLTAYADTYTVECTAVDPLARGSATRDHARGTITIGVDGSVDFDTDISFTADDIGAIYDRTMLEGESRRVHVNYDADDSGRKLQIYLSGTDEVTEITYSDGEGELTRAAIGSDEKCGDDL